jgi:hypothetical protein
VAATAAAVAKDEQRVREERRETATIYPYGLSGTPLSGASLTASTEAKTVAITATFATSRLSELALRASAPLSENEPRTTVLQLDGLANKSRAGAEWRYGEQRLPSVADMKTLTEGLWAICQRMSHEQPSGGERGIEVTGCSIADLQKNPEATALMKRYFPRRNAWYFSLKGDVGPETFKFVDATTFADDKETRWSASGSVVVGLLTARNVYIAGRLRYDHAYEAAKTQAVCSIGTADSKTSCPQKVVGEPTATTLKVTEAEIRRYLKVVSGLNVGASWILRRDWEEKTTSVEFPLYFVKDKDGGLSGGVSIGYVWSRGSDSTGARFTVFVAQAFALGG